MSCLYDIWEPVGNAIAESENMNAPSYYVVILNLVHVFPSELVMISQSKGMNMEFGTSSKNIGLSTKLFGSSRSKYLDFNGIDGIYFFIGKVYNNFAEAVIGSSLEDD